MTKLICTEEFLNEMIKESIIEPQGDGEFVLYSKQNIKGESFPINITCDITVDQLLVKEEKVDNSSKNIDQWYNLIRVEFSTNVGRHLSKDGRNLRSGSKTRIKKNIQALIDQGINLTAVIEAIKYENWWRIKQSTVGDNKLAFMQGLEPWLNNIANIEAMIERSQESNEFKLSQNIINNDGKRTKRKIKIS